MNEAELHLELREGDLEPAIGFWYPQYRDGIPLAWASVPLTETSVARMLLQELFTGPPIVVRPYWNPS